MKQLTFDQIKQAQRILVALIIVGGLWLSVSPGTLPLLLLSLASAALSLLVLIYRKTIMQNYETEFEASGSSNKFTAPSRWVYHFNIYVLWPIVLLLSLYALVVAVT